MNCQPPPLESEPGDDDSPGAIDGLDLTSALSDSAFCKEDPRQQFVLEAARAGTWAWNIETGEVHWSRSLEVLHGLPPGTFGGTFDACLERVHRKDRPRVLRVVRRAINGGTSDFRVEYRQRRHDGRVQWLQGRGRILRDASGRPRGIVGICLDITRRRRSELLLRSLADAGTVLAEPLDYHTTLGNVARLLVPEWADGCVIDLVDRQGHVESATVAHHMDPAKGELLRELRRRFPVSPHDRHGAGAVIRTQQPQQYSEVTDPLLRQMAGSPQHLQRLRALEMQSAVVVPLTAHGETLGAMTLVNTEASHQFSDADLPQILDLARRCALAVRSARLHREMQYELAERRAIEQALRESQTWFRQMVDGLAVGVYTTNCEGRILRHNEEAARIWGPKPAIEGDEAEHFSGACATYWPDGTPVSPEDSPMAAVLRHGKRIHNVEIVIERPDGSKVTALANPSPILDDEGRMIGAINCLIDITLRKQAERLVAERTAEAEERAAQLQRMALELTQAEQRERGKMSQTLHDGLQQLLVAVKMQVAKLKTLDEPAVPDAADRITQLLDQTIDAARSLSHELSPPVLRASGLGAALRWLASHQQREVGLTVHVEAEQEAEPPREEIRVLLFQAVRELLLNVVKHGQTDQAWIDLCRLGGDRIELIVEDRGRGFEPRSSHASESRGVGLFGIEERLGVLGGELLLESAPGRGTRAILRLPIHPELPEECELG